MGISGIAYADTSVNRAYQQNRALQGEKGNTFSLGSGSGGNFSGEQEKVAAGLGMNPLLMGAMRLEGRLTSDIIGLGVLEDGSAYSARYASNSTAGDPIIEISVWSTRKGAEQKTDTYQISVNQVDPTNATQLEMFALCSHADAQGMAGCSKGADTYRKLLDYAEYSPTGDRRAKTADALLSKQMDWTAMVSDAQIEKLAEKQNLSSAGGKRLQELFAAVERQKKDGEIAGLSQTELEEKVLMENRPEKNGVPYSYLAKDGIIEYNGVVFVCDEKRKALCLGDMSDPKKCLTIPLSKGGCLIVNRDNIGDLSKAIGMFSPEDVRLILEAIAQDAKIQQMKNEIDEDTSGIELAEQTGETEEADADVPEEESMLPDGTVPESGKLVGMHAEDRKQEER